MSKITIGISVSLIIVGAIIYTTIYFYRYYQDKLKAIVSSNDNSVLVSISQGMGAKEIGIMLKEKDLIVDSNAFYIYGRVSGNSGNIKAGEYYISQSKTIPEIYEVLSTIIEKK